LQSLGKDNTPLPMLIDRRAHRGFTAVYGYQLAETGQIIGCASPGNEHEQTAKNLKINSREFLEIVAETFVDWLPLLSTVGFQAVWSGYYTEPRMIIDPEAGLFLGLRGQGFMLGQYLARLYVDTMVGRQVPSYCERLALQGDGLVETTMK
jgi:glycine/D-amino acid oxidase-like deaminating enzyme